MQLSLAQFQVFASRDWQVLGCQGDRLLLLSVMGDELASDGLHPGQAGPEYIDIAFPLARGHHTGLSWFLRSYCASKYFHVVEHRLIGTRAL